MSHAHDDDATLIATGVRELEKYPPMAPLGFKPETAFQLAAIVQLARRHPGMPPNLQATADKFLAMVRDYFADAPAVREMLRRGALERYDQ